MIQDDIFVLGLNKVISDRQVCGGTFKSNFTPKSGFEWIIGNGEFVMGNQRTSLATTTQILITSRALVNLRLFSR